MECLKCGVEIGNTFGVCAECRKRSPEDSSGTRHKLFEDLRESRQLPVWQSLWLWLIQDYQRVLNLIGCLLAALLLYFFVVGAGCSSTSSASFNRAPGVTVPEEPQQAPASGSPWDDDRGWQYSARAAFTIRARVLVAAQFSLGAGSDISPFDFTLGWGPMSDTTVLKQLVFTHGFRFVFWNAVDGKSWPVPPDEANRHVSNMHAIPASSEVYQKLERIEVDDIVTFDGFLVSATDGARSWNSSLSRTDIGDGACEVMWITSVTREP